MARQRLSAEEHIRRGTFQRVRHGDGRETPPPLPAAETFYPWLDGLSPEARRWGRWLLERCVPGDRPGFRAYCEGFAVLQALPWDTPVEVREAAHARAVTLLQDAKCRVR